MVPVVGYTDQENPITQKKVVEEIRSQVAVRTADANGVYI
jgi:hypothetical protein